jgi:hypothetical protein
MQPGLLFNLVQIVLAVLVGLVIHNLSKMVLARNDVIKDYTKPQEVVVLGGYVTTKSFFNKRFNTYNPLSTNYIELPKSVNKLGGAQFSYSMWVRFDDVSQSNLGGKVLFMHGDQEMYEMSKDTNGFVQKVVDFIIKCPIVKFGPNGKDIIVEVNTTTEITQRAVIPARRSTDESLRHNVFSLIPAKFVLWTFVFKDDIMPGNIHESGTIFQMYVNDFLYFTQRFKGTLRLNRGTLAIHPLVGSDKSIEGGYLNDLRYYNWALNISNVRKIMARGPPDRRYDDLGSDAPFNEPLYITEYNKLDIYNM